MPGTRCAVAFCNNSSLKTKTAGKNVMYHRFPKNQKIKKQWIHKCYRADKWNPETSCVCSDHFAANDYVRDLKSELLGTVYKPRLKKCAIPSINLKTKPIVETESSRSERMRKRERKALVQELLLTVEPCKDNLLLEESLQNKYLAVQKENDVLRGQVLGHNEELKTLKQENTCWLLTT